MSDCLIPGDFFTPEQWRGSLAPWVDRLVATAGGVLLISVELAPERRNYPEVRLAVFNAGKPLGRHIPRSSSSERGHHEMHAEPLTGRQIGIGTLNALPRNPCTWTIPDLLAYDLEQILG
jgi:hypothetical protein